MFDIKSLEWSETGLMTNEYPHNQFVGTDSALIFMTRDYKNDKVGIKFYRVPVK